MNAERLLNSITNIAINGADMILDRVFDNVGFNRIEDDIFRKLVKARLSYPASKSATVEYLKNHFDDDVSLSKIYRYLDKLSDSQHRIVQDISVEHTRKILGDHIGVLFYDVTTLYFEADYEDELRKTGFSKEGRHKNPQIIMDLLVSTGGYPLTYCIHEGNKYEGHTMLPVVTEFVHRYNLEDFIVVADSGLMNGDNIADLEANGYKYIIGAKIKTESKKIKEWILSQPKNDCQTVEYDKGNGKLETDAKWDGLKGYLTNTNIPASQVYDAYHNLWHVKQAFRISKSKIEIRPMFHFTRRRIEAHVCICFVALKVYKELERLLKLADINMSVDKVLALAQSIVTIQISLPQNKQTLSRTMLMKRHQRIAPLFSDDFW